jgi:exo-beta-1,3-glucanase (GH17 family)
VGNCWNDLQLLNMTPTTHPQNRPYSAGATMARMPLHRASANHIGLALGLASALLLAACGGGTTSDQSNGAIAAASATGLRQLPAAFAGKAVAYSPYRLATTEPGRAAEAISDAQVKQDLDLLVTAGIGLIRLFDSSDKVALRTLRVIRDNALPIKVMLGVYVNSFEYATDPVQRARAQAANEDEMARGVALATTYASEVVAVSVGNETMVSWSFNPISTSTMAGYIKTVRDQIAQPVTTDDNYAFYAGNGRNAADQAADVLRQIDFASIHTYAIEDVLYSNPSDSDTLPDWDWQQLAVTDVTQRAAAMMDAALAKTQRDYALARNYLDKNGRANLPMVIGETGWKAADPSGTGRYKYLGHPANQKMYYSRLLDWAVASRSNSGPKSIVYFEAFDEPWKGSDDKWGLFTVDRKARCAAQALNTGAGWAKETTACAQSEALYFAPPLANAAVATARLTIFNEAVTAWPTNMRADAYETGTFTLTYPKTGDSAPADLGTSLAASNYLWLDTFTPKPYGWGLLWQSSVVPAATANMSNFANGAIHFSVKTAYVGALRVGISSDTVLGAGAEAFVLVSNGNYGYCSGAIPGWCDVSIPLSAFQAANPKLDLRYVLTRFSISDVFADTGNVARTLMPGIALDNIYWAQ